MKKGSRASFTRPKRGRPRNNLLEQSSNESHQTLSDDKPPEIQFQGSIPLSEDEHKVLNALFAYKASLKDSAFFITSTTSSHDIHRYSDQFKKKKTQRSLRDVKTDLAFFPQELHIVKDDSISVSVSNDTNQRKVQFDFGQFLEQESKEKTKNVERENVNELEKYPDMDQTLEEEEYEEAADYIESYFDDGEMDDAFDGDGGGEGEAYFD
ncbi:DNA-directed RNA polymerase III subunit RPC7-like [Rhizophagus clarus]|nr:DNA-directed RNA polymerase III subunit RPC7-like [Rhizophagus clarus]